MSFRVLAVGDGSETASSAVPVEVQTLAFDGTRSERQRSIAVEVPVQVSFGGVPFGVMMLTPCDLEDFAFGFSLTEGVIARAGDIRGVAIEALPDGLHLRIGLSGDKLHAHLARKRAMSGRTSCGLCGIEDLGALRRAKSVKGASPLLALTAIERAIRDLDRQQTLNAATRSVHGAAWCDRSGTIVCVREDVGRHNALDKLFGALLRAATDPDDGFAVITSRASFEMVEKAAAFGARSLVAVSAPTSLAIERARALDITLVGIARQDSVTVFNGIERVTTQTAGLDKRSLRPI